MRIVLLPATTIRAQVSLEWRVDSLFIGDEGKPRHHEPLEPELSSGLVWFSLPTLVVHPPWQWWSSMPSSPWLL